MVGELLVGGQPYLVELLSLSNPYVMQAARDTVLSEFFG